ERGITVVAARLGEGDCGWADAVYGGPFDEVPVGGLDLGPASVSTLSAALKAAAELNLFSTIAILTDRRC
ncbi:MAG: hypothetical protein JZD41_04125, partial [Thermoproteus sp.]|nr:hypothetical protein [Thermoproteus sp.]